jgi:signal transduction histidine kinase
VRPAVHRLPWVLLGATLLLLALTLTFTVKNTTFEEDSPFIALAVAVMLGYVGVGSFVASRVPENPAGWLLLATGIAFVVAAAAEEYATFGIATDPGGVPFASAALWLANWAFLLALAPVPLFLTLFPSGRVASPRWRWLPASIVTVFAVGIVGTMVRPGPIDVSDVVPDPLNPTGVAALRSAISVVLWTAAIAGIGVSLAAVVSLVQRYRAAQGDERQQIRWLAYVGLAAIVLFIATALTAIPLESGQSSALNDGLFYAFFAMFGFGLPASAGIAVLRYRLWDLDVVLKKALVATVVVVLITAVSLVALVVLSGIVVGPVSDRPGLTLVAGLVIGALFWPLLRLSRRIADRIVYGGRATPYEILTEFSGRMAESYATDDVLPRMTTILAEGTGAERVAIWLQVGRELRPAAAWPEPGHREELKALPLFAVARPDTFEVRHQGELLGAITVAMPANDPMDPSKERLIHDLASQAGLVLRNVRLIEELRESRRRIVAAVDAGRRRLERNIHDGAQQQLVALAVKLRLAEGALDRDPHTARELIGQLQREANDALETLRDLARGIYPPLLADEGLSAALRAQARKSPVPVHVAPDGIGRYSQEIEASVYFCVLEALQNVAKYARATRVDVALRHDRGRLAFEVRDDGVGFDPATAPRGTGLQGMADRIEAVGGELEISAAPGRGTTVSGAIPV